MLNKIEVLIEWILYSYVLYIIKLVEMVNAKFFRSVDGNALIAMTSAREGLSTFVFCGSRCWWTYYFVSIIFILTCCKEFFKKKPCIEFNCS